MLTWTATAANGCILKFLPALFVLLSYGCVVAERPTAATQPVTDDVIDLRENTPISECIGICFVLEEGGDQSATTITTLNEAGDHGETTSSTGYPPTPVNGPDLSDPGRYQCVQCNGTRREVTDRLRFTLDQLSNSGRSDSVIELSVSGCDFMTFHTGSSNANDSSDHELVDVLCRLRNVRRLVMTGLGRRRRSHEASNQTGDGGLLRDIGDQGLPASEQTVVIDDAIDYVTLFAERLANCYEQLAELAVNGWPRLTDVTGIFKLAAFDGLVPSVPSSSSSLEATTGVDWNGPTEHVPPQPSESDRCLGRLDFSGNSIKTIDVELATLSSVNRRQPEIFDVSKNELTALTKSLCYSSRRKSRDRRDTASTNDTETTRSTVDASASDFTSTKVPTLESHLVRIGSGNVSCTWAFQTTEAVLQSFNASFNEIDSVAVGIFDGRYRNLITLDLSHNKLAGVKNGTFVDLFSLQFINLSHNSLIDLDVGAFTTSALYDVTNETGSSEIWRQNRGSASAADREQQYYIRLASCTSGWLDIQVVDLTYNKLTSLRDGTLESALCAVRHLLLRGNLLDRLPRYVFEHLPYLQTLDLSDNRLAWLDVGAFTNPSLAVLDLSGNRLRKIVSMTFLYLPAIRQIDLTGNEISYIYKFAFYRMCSSESTVNPETEIDDETGNVAEVKATTGIGRRIEILLRGNKLGADAVWKMLTTFEHLETEGCIVDVDLRNNAVERFLPPEPLEFVRKRLEEMAETSTASGIDQSVLLAIMQHFRRWDRVIVRLDGNRIRCDCSLINELNAVDRVVRFVTNGSSAATGNDVITKSWRKLNCSGPEEYSTMAVWQFTRSASFRCRPVLPLPDNQPVGFCACSTTARSASGLLSGNCSATVMNCSGLHLMEFKMSAATKITSFERIHSVDLSNNALTRLEPEVISRWFPQVRVVYLHRNHLTSLPPLSPTQSFPIHVTLAGNPLSCTVCAESDRQRYPLVIIDWNRVTCADGSRPLYISTSGHACILRTPGSGVTVSRRPSLNAPGNVPRVMLIVGLILAVVLVFLLVLTLIGLISWSNGSGALSKGGILRRQFRRGWGGHAGGGWFGAARVRDIQFQQNAIDSVISTSGDDLFVIYSMADGDWVASHLLPIVRQFPTTFGTLRLQAFDGPTEVNSRQFLGDFRQNLDECSVAIVVLSTEFIESVSNDNGNGNSEFIRVISGYCKHYTAAQFVFVLIEDPTTADDYNRQLLLINRLLPDIGRTTCLIFGNPSNGNEFTERLRHHLQNHRRRRQHQQLQQRQQQQHLAANSCGLFCRLRHLLLRLQRRCSTSSSSASSDISSKSPMTHLPGNRRQLLRRRCDGVDDDCYGNLDANQVVLDANEKLMSGVTSVTSASVATTTERY